MLARNDGLGESVGDGLAHGPAERGPAAVAAEQEEAAVQARPRWWFFGLERNVFFAGVVSFFMDVSSEMVYSLVPLFLSSVLGVSGSVIGLIEGIAETTASMLKLVSGWLSDRIGRRKELMALGYGISALSRIGLALSQTWGQVLGVRFTDRFGKGIRTAPRDAIVAESSPARTLGRSFGFHRAMDQSGAVLGPAIAAFILLADPGGFRTVFWLSLIPGMIAVLVIVFFIKDPKRPSRRTSAQVPAPQPGGGGEGFQVAAAGVTAGPAAERLGWWRRVGRLRGPLLTYILITGVFSLGNSSDVFLILRARDLGVALALVPILYVAFNVVYSSLSIPAGLLADRVGRRRVAIVGFLVFAGVYTGMALAEEAVHAWALFLLYGVYMGISDGNGRALLAELAPADRKGTAFGFYHSVVGMAALPASAAAGLLWDRVSHAAPFWLGAGGALLAALLLLLLVPEPQRQDSLGGC